MSRWNVKRVKNMYAMFCGVEYFNQDLSSWNVEKCKNMSYMFDRAKKLNKDSIKNWDLSGKDTSGKTKKCTPQKPLHKNLSTN